MAKQEPTEQEVSAFQESMGNHYDKIQGHEQNMDKAIDKQNPDMYKDQANKREECIAERDKEMDSWNEKYGNSVEGEAEQEKGQEQEQEEEQDMEK